MYRQKCKQKPKWKIQLKTIQQAEQTPADVFRKKLVYDNIMEKSQMLVQQILKHSNLWQKQQEEPLLMVIQIC